MDMRKRPEYLSIRLDKDLRQKLKLLADSEHRTVGSLAYVLLLEAVQKKEKEQKA